MVSAQPLISCIVPVFNGERYLQEALDSILSQTWRPIEIVLVDDGSTDGTERIARRYPDSVRYVLQEHAGVAAARNLGLHSAKGEFVSFLDSDDLWHPEKLERQMGRFASGGHVDICIVHQQNFWIPEMQHEAERYRDHPAMQPKPGYVCQTLLTRAETFRKVGNFDPSLRIGEDTDWYSRAEMMGLVVDVVGEVMVWRRLHGGNLSLLRYSSKGRDEQLRVVYERLKGLRAVRPSRTAHLTES